MAKQGKSPLILKGRVSKLWGNNYKIAFQWDAYRPLVDRIPTCTAQGGVPTRGVFLPGGWYLGGVPAQGDGCTCWGCTCPGEVGVPAWGEEVTVCHSVNILDTIHSHRCCNDIDSLNRCRTHLAAMTHCVKKLDTVTVFGTLCEQMYMQVRMVRHRLWLRSMQVIDYIGLCEAVHIVRQWQRLISEGKWSCNTFYGYNW